MRHKMCVYVHVCRHLLFGDGFIFPVLFPFIYLLLLRFFFRIKWVINCINVPGRERIISHCGWHARRKIKFRGRRRRRFYANIMCDRRRPNWARRGCYFPGNSLYQSQRTTLHSFSDLVLFTVLLFCLIL